MASYYESLTKTEGEEGGYSNDPDDSGGETYMGISRNNNPDWAGWAIIDDIKKTRTITDNEIIQNSALDSLVKQRYKQQYWDSVQGDAIQNQQFADFLFDFYVNAGTNAVKQLQKVLGLNADGDLGSDTLNALNSSPDLNSVYTKYYQARIDYYTSLAKRKPKLAKFLHGWLKRVSQFPNHLAATQKAGVELKGDDSTIPSPPAAEKKEKQEVIKQTKSEIKSKAKKDTKIKKAIAKCPLKSSGNSESKKPKKEKTTSVKCNLSALQVEKDGRGYTLNVKATPGTCTSGDLAIVAGYNKRIAKVKCSLNGLAGPCNDSHKTKVFDFNDHYTIKTDSKLDFDAASIYEFSFFPNKPTTNVYHINANTCDASVGAVLTVYPDTYWHFKVTTTIEEAQLKELKIEGDFKQDQNSVSFSVSSSKELSYDISNDSSESKFEGSEDGVKYGYKDDNTTIGFAASEDRVESNYEDKSTQTKSHTSFATASVGGVTAVEIKDMSYESGGIKAQINERLRDNLNGLFQTIKIINFIKGLLDKLSATGASPVSFELDYPNIELDAKWQWKEISGSPKCGFEYSVSGGLHPVIGCGVEVDLLGAALLAIPVWGGFINKMLQVIEYISGDEIKINLKLNGDLEVDIDITKDAAADSPTINTPDCHVDIVLVISATLKLKNHNCILGYGGGGKGSSKITITLHKPVIQDEGINLPCEFLFAGITLTKVEYVKEGSFWSSVLPDEDEEVTEQDTDIGTWLEGESHAFTVPLI